MLSVHSAPVQRVYRRSPPTAKLAVLARQQQPSLNSIALQWQSLLSLEESGRECVKLRNLGFLVRAMEGKIADVQWFAILSVPGLREQIVQQSGLREYSCGSPADVSPQTRTDAWQLLVSVCERWPELQTNERVNLMSLLNQLTLPRAVIKLARRWLPSSANSAGDQYLIYEVARARHRLEPHAADAIAVLDRLARGASLVELRTWACAQMIAHHVRVARRIDRAIEFVALGRGYERQLLSSESPALGLLIWSRFLRAAALLEFALRSEAVWRVLEEAQEAGDEMRRLGRTPAMGQLADENRKVLLESRIKAAGTTSTEVSVDELIEELLYLDGRDPDSLLCCGDAVAKIGDLHRAAALYSSAGELGTVSAAIGWYRAGQCFEALRERKSALRCYTAALRIDPAGVEPAARLSELGLGGVDRVTTLGVESG